FIQTVNTAAAKTTTKKGFIQKEVLSFATYKRKTLLERKSRGMVSEIVVTHCDRLCHNLIHSPHTTKLMVFVNKATSDEHKLAKISLKSSKEKSRPTRTLNKGKSARSEQQQHATNDNT